jgi:hypothetical protein
MFEEEERVSPIASGSSSVEEVEAVQESTTEVGTASETTGMSQSHLPFTPKKARKLYDEEKRAVGRIARNIWLMYFRACGSWLFWGTFVLIFVLASISPIFNNGWLRWIYLHSWCAH